MKIKITFEPVNSKGIILPFDYNYLIQGFIYNNLKKTISSKIHNKGFNYQKRSFRLFVFSRLYGNYERIENRMKFKSTCYLYIASPIIEILESFATSIVKKNKVKIGENCVYVNGIEVSFIKDFSQPVYIKTLSPITVYSTLLTKDGKRKTYYYSPFENEFSKQIRENLIKKYTILNYERNFDKMDFNINPYKVSKNNEHIVLYKNTVIKAWSGIYRIEGSKELLEIAFDCGIGSKNSQGFGMIELFKLKEDR